MDCHFDLDFFRYFDDACEKIAQIFPKVFFCNMLIGLQQIFHLIFCIAGVPTGKREIAGQGVHVLDCVFVIDQRVRAIRQRMRQFAARPVKDRHKVIADTVYSGLGKIAQRLAIVFYIPVAVPRSPF